MTMCYGNCFLKRNLKLDNETEKSTVPSGNKSKIEISSYIISEDNFTFTDAGILTALLQSNCSLITSSGFPTTIFHPPVVV